MLVWFGARGDACFVAGARMLLRASPLIVFGLAGSSPCGSSGSRIADMKTMKLHGRAMPDMMAWLIRPMSAAKLVTLGHSGTGLSQVGRRSRLVIHPHSQQNIVIGVWFAAVLLYDIVSVPQVLVWTGNAGGFFKRRLCQRLTCPRLAEKVDSARIPR